MLNRCYIGDCLDGLREFTEAGIRAQTCVTSPPYWGLRDYGAEGQLGLEPTPDAYVARLVAVFRAVRDVLADDGTVWLNLGDSYANPDKGGYQPSRVKAEDSLQKGNLASDFYGAPNRNPAVGLKPKNLVGVPWRVAFALQADGWYLRQDIIWHKPNPMPESVRDRCTKAHEYLFLLSKSERYYYDADAIMEESVTDDPRRPYGSPGANAMDPREDPQGGGKVRAPANVKRGEFSGKTNALEGREAFRPFTERRNRRSVWTVPNRPFSGAHFATFPPGLIEPCILAGSRSGDVVLDPFMGSGTTAQVAEHLGRQWIGCEINPEYVELQRERLRQQALAL